MHRPTVFYVKGSPYSSAVLIALREKGVEWIDGEMPLGTSKSEANLARHPFGRVPSIEHDGFVLYETQAILRYIDQVFDGPALQPRDAREAARMNQAIGIHDAYASPSIAAGVCFNRILAKRFGRAPDESAIAAALPMARTCLREWDRFVGTHAFLAGDALSLADCLVAPMIAYLVLTPEVALLEPHPRLRAWWQRVSTRPAVAEFIVR